MTDTSMEKLIHILAKFLTALLLGVCWCLPESFGGLIRNDYTQIYTHNRSEHDRSAWDALYDTTP
jgi:hypothetical protein